MKHITTVEETPDGHLGRCETCGERNSAFAGYGAALQWCDEHEQSPRREQRGARPGLKALERMYRERSINNVYSVEERLIWVVLADEIAERTKHKADTIEGQLSIFGEEEDLDAYAIRNAHTDQRGD